MIEINVKTGRRKQRFAESNLQKIESESVWKQLGFEESVNRNKCKYKNIYR